MKIAFVTFLWHTPGYRSAFSADTVNALYRQCLRHCRVPFTFYCVTDTPEGLEPGIAAVPLWDDYKDLPNPSFRNGPSCYRRLKIFSKQFADVVGDVDRIVHLDQDMIILSDITALVSMDREPFYAWRPQDTRYHVCGSMFSFWPGSAAYRCWDTFVRLQSTVGIARYTLPVQPGSDQGWMAYYWGDFYGAPSKIPSWTHEDGVYAYSELARWPELPPGLARQHKRGKVTGFRQETLLPPTAKIIAFTGKPDPWDKEALSESPWLKPLLLVRG